MAKNKLQNPQIIISDKISGEKMTLKAYENHISFSIVDKVVNMNKEDFIEYATDFNNQVQSYNKELKDQKAAKIAREEKLSKVKSTKKPAKNENKGKKS